MAIGSLLGGYLVKKLNLNAEGATKLALGCSVIALVGQIALLGIGCDSAGIGGVDTPYHNSRFVKPLFYHEVMGDFGTLGGSRLTFV